MGFAGQAYRADSAAERLVIGREEGLHALSYAAALAAAGFESNIVSVGCTPSTPGACTVEGVTETCAGCTCSTIASRPPWTPHSVTAPLTVLATVVSRPTETRFVVDAGLKALAGEDYGWGTYGLLADPPEVEMSWAAEEHGIVEAPAYFAVPSVGDLVRIIPNHACGAVNMHNVINAVNMHNVINVVRGERVVDEWAVVARGPAN